LRYLSVCSGIEAASVAWEVLGWEPVAFSEIEAFPSAVLAHHYPTIPNLGDMTKFKEWNLERGSIDLLVGGTPCQSFSVAGLRKGLEDPRGNLMLVYLGLLDRFRPKWMVWENVPGVLSSNKGRDFGAFLGGLAELGYGFAYRVLDARYLGVPQRRRRVFVVGYLGDWRPPAAVLFERHSLSGNPAPRWEAGIVAPTLSSSGAGVGRTGNERTEADFLVMAHGQGNAEVCRDGSPSLTCNHEAPILAHALTKRYDSSEDGTGRGTPLVTAFINQQFGKYKESEGVAGTLTKEGPSGTEGGNGAEVLVVNARQDPDISEGFPPPLGREDRGHAVAYPLDTQNMSEGHASGGLGFGQEGDPSFTLTKGHSHVVAIRTAQTSANGHGIADDVAHTLDQAQGQAIAFAQNSRDELREMDVVGALAAQPGMKQTSYIRQTMAVRRLTPRECERLQGFPDDWTQVPYRGKPAADGPRYKACGNSMAVPVMLWIGKRIQEVGEMAGVDESC